MHRLAPNPIIETRLIYTQGVYVFSDAMRACRQITIVTDLLRFPTFTVYANEKSNPPYYFLGYYTVWKGSYVESRLPLEFTEQVVFSYDNPHLQSSNLLLAAATNLGNTIQALGSAMTPPALILFQNQAAASGEACPYTQLKFKMPLGTRIQLTAIGIPLEAYASAQAVAPSLHQPTDQVPRYPVDRSLYLDPPRSPAYTGESPGDTAPASASDPDSSLPSVVCRLTFNSYRSDIPSFVGNNSFIVPNNTYTTAYVDIVSTSGSTYSYYTRSNGSAGIVTLQGPFNPNTGVFITYRNFAVNCI